MASHVVVDCDGYVYVNGMRSCKDETGGTVVSIVEVLQSDGELAAVANTRPREWGDTFRS